jgi:hypothetical protein
MADGFVHTVFKSDQWVNEIEGGDPLGGTHATKTRPSRSVGRELNRTRPST